MIAFILRRIVQSVAVMAVVSLIAFVFVLLNLIVDLLCHAVDPRLRLERGMAY